MEFLNKDNTIHLTKVETALHAVFCLVGVTIAIAAMAMVAGVLGCLRLLVHVIYVGCGSLKVMVDDLIVKLLKMVVSFIEPSQSVCAFVLPHI